MFKQTKIQAESTYNYLCICQLSDASNDLLWRFRYFVRLFPVEIKVKVENVSKLDNWLKLRHFEGGPLLWDESRELIGVTSTGIPFLPQTRDHVTEIQIFTRVPYYYAWIERQTGLELPKCNGPQADDTLEWSSEKCEKMWHDGSKICDGGNFNGGYSKLDYWLDLFNWLNMYTVLNTFVDVVFLENKTMSNGF